MKKLILIVLILFTHEFAASQPQVQWVKRFGSTGWDVPLLVKSDNLGNIYVTGTFDGLHTAYCATIKYNYNGDSVWSRNFFAPDTGNTSGSQLLFDDSNNLYISGRYILKYTHQGDLLYSRYYGCSTNKMSFDKTNNIVYAGKDQRIAAGLVLLKCNRSGDSLWRKIYPQPVGYTDVRGIVIDKKNNIICTGQYYTGSSYDYITTKFDENGNIIWYRTVNGTVSEAYDDPIAVALDSLDNIIVAGTSEGSSGDNFYTIKYDSSGSVMWQQRYPAGGSGSADMKIDKAGNIYICGITGVTNYATMKYSSTGNLIWYQTTTGVGFPPDNSLTLDTSGNVYMACNLNNSQGYSGYQIIKYTNSGNLVWNVFYPETGIRANYSTAIDVDMQGNVFVTGESQAAGTSYDYMTIRINQTTGVNSNQIGVAKNFILSQNYPNPFNPNTIISLKLQAASFISLNVYDTSGKLVKILESGYKQAGNYSTNFSAEGLSSGIYYYSLFADGVLMDTKKMILLK